MSDIRKFIRKVLFEGSKPQIAYSAVVIEDPSEIGKINDIVKKYVPVNKGWRKPHNYHMTIMLGKFPESLYLRGDLNKEVELKIDSIGISNSAIALGTNGYYSKNDMPHITIAFHKHSEPAASKFIKDWEPIDEFSVTGVIREVAVGNVVLKESLKEEEFHKIKLYTNPAYKGIGLDENPEKEKQIIDSIPITTFTYDGKNLIGFEDDSKMELSDSKKNVENMMANIYKGNKLPPLLIRKYKNIYQVLDGHHRFWAYKQLAKKYPEKYGSINFAVKIIPDNYIEETNIIPK